MNVKREDSKHNVNSMKMKVYTTFKSSYSKIFNLITKERTLFEIIRNGDTI